MIPYDARSKMPCKVTALYLTSDKQYQFASKQIDSGIVLDVGCGVGTLAKHLKQDVKYVGIDATQWCVDECVKGKLDVTFFDVMNYTGKKADYVCAFGVLETSPNLKALADKLKSLAKKAVLFSFTESGCGGDFKNHSRDQIELAFGEVEFFDGDDETYCRILCG
jgi:SAM-dependent methyltransferase